mmetsp:Transcript_5056/g.17653  ORF Transcript_5056/g.17653 Transcript_5056/m.17653 type:complete len:218 (-) Transcript_5056:76-729(-)
MSCADAASFCLPALLRPPNPNLASRAWRFARDLSVLSGRPLPLRLPRPAGCGAEKSGICASASPAKPDAARCLRKRLTLSMSAFFCCALALSFSACTCLPYRFIMAFCLRCSFSSSCDRSCSSRCLILPMCSSLFTISAKKSSGRRYVIPASAHRGSPAMTEARACSYSASSRFSSSWTSPSLSSPCPSPSVTASVSAHGTSPQPKSSSFSWMASAL